MTSRFPRVALYGSATGSTDELTSELGRRGYPVTVDPADDEAIDVVVLLDGRLPHHLVERVDRGAGLVVAGASSTRNPRGVLQEWCGGGDRSPAVDTLLRF